MTPERRRDIHRALMRFADGDRSAIDVLVAELWPVLLDFARRGLSHEQDAEDVAQNVFVRLCARIAEFDQERDGLSWAFGIANYEVLSQRQRYRRRREESDSALADRIDDAATVEDAFGQQQLLRALEHTLGSLDESDRLLLAGASAGAAGATQRKRRQRALDRLRQAWRSLYGRP